MLNYTDSDKQTIGFNGDYRKVVKVGKVGKFVIKSDDKPIPSKDSSKSDSEDNNL